MKTIRKITNRFLISSMRDPPPTGFLRCKKYHNFTASTSTTMPGRGSTSSILFRNNTTCPRYWLFYPATHQRYLHCMTLPLVHDNKTLVLLFRSTHSWFRKSNCCCWKRHQSSDESFRRGNTNPYAVLGVSSSSTLEEVQKAFVKLALEHHPDTSLSSSEPSANDTNNNDNHTNFIRIRQAFEAIRTAHGHGKRNAEWSDDDDDDDDNDNDYVDSLIHWTEQDFLDWFYEETGTRLDSDQRRELVSLYRNRVQGGQNYHGPSWELARRLVAEQDAFFRAQQMELGFNGGTRQQIRRTPFQKFQQQQRQQQQQQQQRGSKKQSTTASSQSTSNLRRKRTR